MAKIRLRFTISGEYEVETDDPSFMDAYGTDDPEGVAKVEQEVLADDPMSFLHHDLSMKVEVVSGG